MLPWSVGCSAVQQPTDCCAATRITRRPASLVEAVRPTPEMTAMLQVEDTQVESPVTQVVQQVGKSVVMKLTEKYPYQEIF